MSVVTNLVLSLGFSDSSANIGEVNRFFDNSVRGLTGVHDPALPHGWYGGTKMLEARLFIGAFNHLDLSRFIKHLCAIQWHEPECVQLFVKEQEDARFWLLNIEDELARDSAPSGK